MEVAPSRFEHWMAEGKRRLLQTEQHQNFTSALLERLERFADQGAGTVKLHAAHGAG